MRQSGQRLCRQQMPLQMFQRRLAKFLTVAQWCVKCIESTQGAQIFLQPSQIFLDGEFHQSLNADQRRCARLIRIAKEAHIHNAFGKLYSRRRCECAPRSEEHTSELQSHVNLVCRLLLEKKNKPIQHTTPTS